MLINVRILIKIHKIRYKKNVVLLSQNEFKQQFMEPEFTHLQSAIDVQELVFSANLTL